MSGLVFLIAITAASAAAAAPPPPAAVTSAAPETRKLPPATPARIALARKLVGYTQPPELMTSAVVKGWEEGLKNERESFDSLEAIQAGLGAKLADRGKAEIVSLVRERIPQLHDRLGALFADNCTEQELQELIVFYSSPAGSKLIRSITLSNSADEVFEDDKVTAAEAIQANRQASRAAVQDLSSAEQAEVVKFAFSPAGNAVKTVGPRVQAISAEWMTATMAAFDKRIEPIVQQIVGQAVAEAK